MPEAARGGPLGERPVEAPAAVCKVLAAVCKVPPQAVHDRPVEASAAVCKVPAGPQAVHDRSVGAIGELVRPQGTQGRLVIHK